MGVGRGDHPGDRGGPRLVELVLGRQLGDPEGEGRGHAGRGGEDRQAAGEMEDPAGTVGGQRRELPGPVRGRQHLLLHPGRRGHGAGQGQPGRGLSQAADLRLAGGAVVQVALELLALRVADGVQGVAAGEYVQVVTHGLHQVTSMQSRILINPSLILVLTVPRATPSSFATCG